MQVKLTKILFKVWIIPAMEVILDLGLLVSLLVIAFIDNIIFVFFTPHRPIILSN
jgi:hypothetical protein